ncbi:hypothetical protein [Streptomyces sp. OK228]|uniref:hypothetical protein n=1 Tax=Streptomyces sp. OK228 TaxID=1882786 RepID=UPI000BD9160C|nr:hypothetical protein [Streptomyces sp. OK228]SOE30055.1 hypothetical protein SAMN05442782_6942 [Streptomyces sp. OK228]
MTNGTTTDVTRPSRTPTDSPLTPYSLPTARRAPVPPGTREPGGTATRPALRPVGGDRTPAGRPAADPAPAASPSASLAEGEAVGPLRERGGRGRHRKPRPRRALFAVGGLALAAGALSLARMAPESVVGGGSGNTEAEPRPGAATDEALDAAPTVWAVPSAHPASPGSTGAQGGASATPTSGVSPAPTAPSTAASPSATATIPSARASAPVGSVPDTTGIPTAPVVVPSQPHTRPTPAPSPTTHTPAPAPTQNPPGLCVPIVGICVNDLAGPAGGH